MNGAQARDDFAEAAFDRFRRDQVVEKAGGQCRLYATRGSAHDYVSVITGVAPAAAIRLVETIESTGAVKATLVSGLEMFGGAR